MLLQHCYRLLSLLVLFTAASAFAPAYPPPGAVLKPRYLVTGAGTGTGIPSPPATAPTNATRTVPPTGSAPAATASATPVATPFYLVAAARNSSLSGHYLTLGIDLSGAQLLVAFLSPPDDCNPCSTFTLNADGTLQSQGQIACVFPQEPGTYAGWMWDFETFADEQGYVKSICGITTGGELTCETGGDGVFSACPYVIVDEFYEVGGNVDVGPGPEPGCTEVTLMAVPV